MNRNVKTGRSQQQQKVAKKRREKEGNKTKLQRKKCWSENDKGRKVERGAAFCFKILYNLVLPQS
jgi:hypothetical protein